MRFYPFYFLSILLLFNCKKDQLKNTFETIEINSNIRLTSVFFTTDSIGYICGGNRDENGFIYQTIDAGKTWKQIYESDFNRCLYSIHFLNDSIGYAGGDYTYLIKTTDAGKNWDIQWFNATELAYHEKNRPDIKDILFIDSLRGYFVGGENYNRGAIYKSIDGGDSWTFDTLDNEIKSISISPDLNGFACGFGYLGKTSNGEQFNLQDFKGDFFTDVQYLQNNSFIIVTNTGEIINYSNGKYNTVQSSKKFKRIGYTSLASDNNYVIAAGNKGVVSESNDYGESWNSYSIDKQLNFTSIALTSSYIFITCDNGNLLRINRY